MRLHKGQDDPSERAVPSRLTLRFARDLPASFLVAAAHHTCTGDTYGGQAGDKFWGSSRRHYSRVKPETLSGAKPETLSGAMPETLLGRVKWWDQSVFRRLACDFRLRKLRSNGPTGGTKNTENVSLLAEGPGRACLGTFFLDLKCDRSIFCQSGKSAANLFLEGFN